MAYIAPSLWAVNQYGEGLRAALRRSRQLERWVDFKAHQVFAEAITYTALQFFTHEPNDAVRIVAAPNGETQDVDWADGGLAVPYDALPPADEWLMATGAERALIDRLARDCLRLDDPSLTSAIYQGLITSADAIYHLERCGTGRYVCTPKEKGAKPYEVAIEDAIMKPLVSGAEAKRYEDPETTTYLLFPYERDARGVMGLIAAKAMAKRFPKAWAHLGKWEKQLRARESGKMDRDADWWGYVYPKNLDKHERQKLIVAQTVPGMRVCADLEADKYLNNVRVNGILPTRASDQAYLLGMLNGPVADFVFRRIGKPKQGGWFEANKQFIAPLPIPKTSAKERQAVAKRAGALQQSWTRRRELLEEAAARLSILARVPHPARWLWPDLPDLPEKLERAPRGLRSPTDRRKWAEAALDELEATRREALQAVLDRGGTREVRFEGGELRLYVDGAAVLERIFLPDDEGRLAEAYWRWLLLSARPKDAARFAAELRRPPAASVAPAAAQFIERVAALAAEVAAIEAQERAMNEMLYELYRLSPAERNLVENEPRRRSATGASR